MPRTAIGGFLLKYNVSNDTEYLDGFQCRERLEWDFYLPVGTRTVPLWTHWFQCRERLEWDFYQVVENIARCIVHEFTFQCCERLEWDFYARNTI